MRNLLKIGAGYSITAAGKATLDEIAARAVEATSVKTKTLDVTEAASIVLNLLKSADFVTGSLGTGVSIYKNGSSWKMEIDELLVRKIATFLKLEIRELSYVGGNIVLSKAGNEITKVESVAGGWKCYFTTNDGSKEVENLWKAGDQAKCQTVNLKEGTNENAGNKYYWRLVTETGDDYVVLSSSDKDDATDNDNPNCVPAVGDKIVQMGFRLSGDEGDKDRTSLIILSTSGENTPSIEAYTGVTAYELGAEKRLFILSPGEVSFRSDLFRWMSGGVKFPQEVYRGDWESGTAYNYYDKVTHDGSTWICIAPDGTEGEPVKGSAAWKEYAEKGKDGKDYWRTAVWLDATAYDEDKWIPFTGTSLPRAGYGRICVSVHLNSKTTPSWSTHASGFSVDLDFDMQANEWGATYGETLIYTDTFRFCDVSPASCGQMGYSSTPVLYLRGGGKYFVQANFDVTWTARPNGYTWTGSGYSQTVEPQDNRPEPAGKSIQGADGKGIKSITEYYLATSAGSGVTTGTSGWTTAVQTITAAKRFLWNYEKVAYTDGTSSESSPVIIGVYGEKGEAGTSVTVSSTTTTYAAGTSGTTPPDGGWSETVPAVAAGQYLWGKTVVAYSDGKSTTTYSVSYQGTDGQPGDDGTSVTITGQATKYAVTTTAGQPADSAFTSDKIPALSPGDYLWSRTTVTYSGGVQTKSYAVSRIGADGTDGLPGTDGKDSYTHFAYASSADGETGFSTTYFEGALYLGTCSDFNKADPEDYKAYSWARMKGDTGAVGETLLGGKMLFTDPEFKDGENGIAKYSNGTAENKAKLVVERISTSGLADVPTQSGYCIRVTVGAAQRPGHGGVIQRILSRPGAVFVQKIIAKIPSGYTLESTSNQMGTGYKQKFLTSRAGTGKYETYLIKTTCGVTGSFSDGGHIYINGGSTPTEAAPLVWYIAYMTAFDLTADGYGQITDEINASLAKTVQVTADGQVFRYGAGYTGNPFPASITLTAEAKNFEPKSWQWQYLDGTSWKTISNATGSTYIVEPGNTTLFGTGVYVRTLRCVCDGDESKSDTFTLAKLADGAPGTEGKDAYSVLLTNESHTFAGDASGAVAGSAECGVAAYKGSQRVAATIGTITGMPAGMSIKISDNGTTGAKFTVTVSVAMTTRQGVLTVPVTVDGVQFEKRFSFALALAGVGYSPNLIIGTKEMDGWSWGHDNPGRVSITREEDENGFYRIKSECIQAGRVNGYTWIHDDFPDEPHNIFKPGEKYTLSLEYKATNTVLVGVDILEATTNTKISILPATYFPASENWTRISLEGICPTGADNEKWKRSLLRAALSTSSAAVGDVAYIRKICLVEGEGTQWVPASQDMLGQDGAGVVAVKNLYKAGTSGTEAPEGTYSEDVTKAGFSETNKYLWGYEVNTLSDGKTIETTKHLVAVWGQTGKPGTDGTKIIPAELTTAFNATYVQWLTLYNQTVGKVWNVDNASDYRVGDIAVITGNVTDRGNIKASLYASVITVNTSSGIISTRSYSLVVGNQGEQGVPGSSGIDAKRNLLLNSEAEVSNTEYGITEGIRVSPSEGYVIPVRHTGSLVEGEKYTVVICFTPNAAGRRLMFYHSGTKELGSWAVGSTAERQVFKRTFTFRYGEGLDPRPVEDGGDGVSDFELRVYYGSSSDHPGGTLHWIKLVRGEVATDEWTPAPEDSNNFDVQVSPAALSFKTDEDDGSVIYSGNTATLTATHGGQPAKVSYVSSSAQLMGLTGLQNSGSGTETMKVTLTGISYTTQELKVPNGTGYDTKQMKIPVTSGQAAFKVKLTYAGYTEERTITVPFTVDVKASLVSFGTTANSIVGQVWDTNGVVSRLSKVEQTAGSITSTVESILVSSPNLLDGSKLRLVTTGESRHLYVRLTAGKWYMFSARAMINSTLLNGSQKLLVSCYETNPNTGGWGANHVMTFDNTSWEIKKLDVAFQAQYTSVAHVYAVTINSDGKGEAAVSGGAGFVDWVQLEECEPNSTVATAWKPSANDNVVRPSLVAADAWSFNSGVADVDDVLADGTTGKVKHINVPLTPYQAVEVVSANPSPLFVKAKTQYTISVWAKGTGSMNMFLRASQTAGVIYGKDDWQVGNTSVGTFNLTQEWQKYEATVTTGAAVTENAVCAARIYAGSEIWCYGWKVEKGGTATDSSLIDSVSGNFKSEIKQTADEINLSVEDVKTGVEAVGIKLDGKNSTMTLTGKKVKIEEGAEFNANNATFKNIKVEGILSSVVSTTGYDNRNYFIGDDCIPGAPLNILVTKMNDNAAGTEQHLFLPCDYDFIGSHVMILADNISDSTGQINAQTLYTHIYAGRNYMKHAYLTQGQGTSAAPYKISQEMLAVDDSAYAGTGDMLRDTYQQVFSGAQFFGRWMSTAGTGTEGDNISGSYAPDRISIVSGYIEFVGVPAPTAKAILFPYKVELQTDNSGAQTDDSNSHLLKVSYVSKTVHFPVAMYGGSPVQDELYNKLKGLYDEKGEDGLPAGVTALGLKYFQYYDPTIKSLEKKDMQLFSVPLCRWYPTSLSALTSTAERSSSAGNNTSVEGAVYQS